MEVKERWWHRLVKISLIGGCTLLSLTAVGISATTWQESRTFHSFDGAYWDTSKPSYLCRTTTYSEALGASVNCGEYHKPIELYDALRAAGRVGDSPEFKGLSEYQQGLAIQSYLTSRSEHFRYGSELSMKNVIASTGVALGLSFALCLVAYGLWRALIYVAHGPGARLTR